MDRDDITLNITAPTRRWFPGCGVNNCPSRPDYAVTFSEGRWGHVHACRFHTRALLLWQWRVASVTTLPGGTANLWSTWCGICELGTDRWWARWA